MKHFYFSRNRWKKFWQEPTFCLFFVRTWPKEYDTLISFTIFNFEVDVVKR